ncbi:MAG: 2-aminobenzoate-CoA ligase [Betaproteobacteria bacterium]|nr:2-aminobenzoate-CoA ligase [Betaproteobacteria bacterium]
MHRATSPASAHRDTFARDHLPPRAQWPEFCFDLPELQYPERMNCATVLLDDMVHAGHGERIAIHAPEGKYSYVQLLALANQIAHVLVSDMGLQAGNRVLLRGANNPMMAACWLAVFKAGGICVGSMPLLRAKELTEIINKAQITHALCDQRLAVELKLCLPNCPTLQTIRYWNDDSSESLDFLAQGKESQFKNVDTLAEDVALIAFTSGTTGKPKGTVHFHRDVIAMCDCFPRSCLKPTPDDIFIGTPPLAFTFGLGGLLCFPLRFGASSVLIEKLTPETLLAAIQKFQASILFTAPTMYRALAGLWQTDDLTSLKKCVSAGEALPDATRQLFKQASGIEIIDGIGATEMMHIFISHEPEHVKRGATGHAIPGYSAAVLDENGERCAPGQIGRLAVKGPTGCRYLADERQKDYVISEGKMRGWNVTGDAYVMDMDGYFIYQARTDDMIISSGYNIAGPEVEGALLGHPAVAECAVIGAPDAERGMIVKAMVVLRAGFEGNDALRKTMQEHVKSSIAPYKYPRDIEFVAALPRTETGKLQRFKLRRPS